WMVVFCFFLATQAQGFSEIAKKALDPDSYLGPLVVLGNAGLDSANIVFLPEVHDDPESLTTQLLLLSKERRKGKPFIVLDESLKFMKKSIWDIFPQKTLEIIAAEKQRASHNTYAPERFEVTLQELANKYKMTPDLNLNKELGIWTLRPFEEMATPFFG